VGVDDQCNIVGAPDLAGTSQTKIEERVRNFADELCDPPAHFTVTLLNVQGKDVLVLEVKEGSEKPYWLKNKGSMTRSGSNDRPTTRYEAQQMFHKPAGPFA
jgi:predicted HTH transcriptional regulator